MGGERPPSSDGKRDAMKFTNDITVSDFEAIIEPYRVDAPSVMDLRVENARLPSMVITYLDLVRKNGGRPPTFHDFVSLMCTRTLQELNPTALAARLRRAYVSLICQHHFGIVCCTRFTRVEWDEKLDMRHGVDIVVTTEGGRYGFDLAMWTERSQSFRKRKKQDHRSADFPVRFIGITARYQVGPFWLFDPRRSGELSNWVYQAAYGH